MVCDNSLLLDVLADIYMEERYQNVTVAVWLAYVLIPILDYLLPLEHYNLPDDRKQLFEKDNRLLFPLYSR